jgi:hypothetical protein
MADDFQTKIELAVWGAMAGGVVSLVVSLLVNLFLPWLRRLRLTRALSIEVDPAHGPIARLRVTNGGYWTVKDAIVYIAIDFSRDDVMPPTPGSSAFITPDHFVPLEGDQLCWSVRSPTPNPIKVDIFAKERQPICPCIIEADYIVVPSEEQGLAEGKRRVFLRRRRYDGRLKLVSADTDARYFSITIDPYSDVQPLRVSRMSWRGPREGV